VVGVVVKSTLQATHRDRYFVSAPVDIFFVGGSSFLLLGVILAFYTTERTDAAVG
jgi:hypothetical protein